METISLSTYHIYLGPAAAPLGALLEAGDYSQLLVLVDQHTEALCLPRLAPALAPYDYSVIRIPAGEQHKNIDTCQSIWRQLMDARADRQALVINLGGGVIGDMGGFCAATFKRGLEFVQVPTTLLAQVDASIGGKLGIDFGQVKNSIGLFGDPAAVLIDPTFLQTLPPRELRSGFAEMIKHSLIADAGQWSAFQTIGQLADIDWQPLIGPSLRIKQRIVEADPTERGIRKALNFGHTIGHAVEGIALETDRPLLHGEAIAIGMICEAYLSHRQAGLPAEELEQISAFILRLYDHLPLEEAHFEAFFELMVNDKKNEGRQINFSLLPAIGSVKINCTAQLTDIEDSLLYYNGLLVQ
jgi:3-dehydroquinate synthase